MPEDYEVQPGDCISSIAHEHGFFWETLWKHQKNSELKNKRKDPNVLMAGDVVHIPDLTIKEQSGATEQRHRFKLKGVPAKLCLKLQIGREVLRNEEYLLDIDGQVIRGKTDGDGLIKRNLSPNARQGILTIPKYKRRVALNLGHLDPVDHPTGVQQRLRNLGYDVDREPGQIGPVTEASLRRFQKKHGLQETGKADDATKDKLTAVHLS